MCSSDLDAYRETATAWRGSRGCIFSACAADFLRPPDTSIVWSPAHRCLALRSEGGGWRTVIYGPYMKVPAGSWRAEFMLWAEGDIQAGQHIAQVEAFCGPRGICHSAGVMAEELVGGGAVAQVFFETAEPIADFEFRVHGCSQATVLLREVRVYAWTSGSCQPVPDETAGRKGEVEEVFA